MNLDLYIERLDQYASGVMSAEERAAFEAELKENSELQQALALYRESEAVIEQGIENSLRQQFQVWAEEDRAAQPAPVVSKPEAKVVSLRSVVARWSIAASVLLLAGFFYLYQSSQGWSDQSLYATNYDLPDGRLLRGAGPVDLMSQGAAAFSDKNYPAAQAFFSQVPTSDPAYAEAQYFLGHIALQQHQYDVAVAAFNQAVQSNDIRITEKAQWNMVLTYVAAERTGDGNFKTLLSSIAHDANHSYAEQAKVLEGQLGSFRRVFVK